MSDFLRLVCTTCRACPTLITLDPGPDQCDQCCLKRSIKEEPIAVDHQSHISPKRERYDQDQQSTNAVPMVMIPTHKSNADNNSIKRDTKQLDKMCIPSPVNVVAATACATPKALVSLGSGHRDIEAASPAVTTVTAGESRIDFL